MNRNVIFVFLILALVQSQATATDHLRCSAIEDAAVRLACYDKAFPPVFSNHQDLAPKAKAKALSPMSAETLSQGKHILDSSDNFGFGDKRQKDEIREIESSTSPNFVTWRENERIQLENGQVWRVTDGSSGRLVRIPSKVTISKGMFGSFYMSFEGMNRTAKVERIK